MRTLVVSPSVRSFPPEYFESINGRVDHVIIDDSNGAADRSGLKQMKNVIYVDDAFQDKYLGSAQVRDLVPRRNPSCKNFGLIYAWRERYDVVILLDDDCDTRVTPGYLDACPIGKRVRAATVQTPSGWVNTLEPIKNGRTAHLFARGYPYEFRSEECKTEETVEVVSSFNEGMWLGTPDINGMDKLTMQPADYTLETGVCSPSYTRLKDGQNLPLSIMNVQLDVKLIPAFYQPADYPVAGPFRIRRHDDVWSAYVLKRIMDVKNDTMTFGEPLIYHRKAGDAIKEAISENATNLLQPYLTRVIDRAAASLSADASYAENAAALGSSMIAISKLEEGLRVPPVFMAIIVDYADRVRRWANLFV